MKKRTRKIEPRRAGPPPKYPWQAWFAHLAKLQAGTWLVFDTTNFTCTGETFAAYFRYQGRRRGAPVTVHLSDDEILVRLK